MKRVLALAIIIAVLATMVTIQMSPQPSSADEGLQEPPQTVVSDEDGVASNLDEPEPTGLNVYRESPEEGDGPRPEGPADGYADSTELETRSDAHLPEEYERALENWPEEEAGEFREYYLAHPDELAFIDVNRLVRGNGQVGSNFSVRAAASVPAGSPEPVQCGSKVALILDASSSIDEAEMVQLKQAALQVVDNFAGTPTQLGIYNFATQSPTQGTIPLRNAEMSPRSMSGEAAVETAKQAVGNLIAAGGENDLARQTNWEAGLKRVVGQGYDTVLFVTDGEPTAPTDTGETLGSTLYEGIEKAQKVASQLKESEGVEIVGIFVGENRLAPVVTKFCQKASYQEKFNGGQCDRIEQQRAGSDELPVNPVPLPYISDDELIAGVIAEQVKMHRNQGGRKTDTGGLAVQGPLSSTDQAKVRCSDKYWMYEGRRYRSLFSCPIGDSDRDFAATKLTAYPRDILNSVSSSTITINDYGALRRKLDELTGSCKGVVRIEKSIVDEKGRPVEGPLSGWSFEASQSIIKSGNSENVVRNKSYETDAQGLLHVRIASSNAGNSGAGTAVIKENQRPGYSLRRQGENVAACTIVGKDGKVSKIGRYENVDGDPFAFRLSNIGQDDKVICRVQNMVARDPEVSLKKRVGFDGRYSDANDRASALDLGRSRDDLSVEFEIENTGPVALGYLELSDRQLDVEGDKPLDLRGLRCGTGNSLTFRGDAAKTVEIRPATPIAPGQKITCRKDGGNAFRVRDLGFRESGTAAGGYKYFGNEGKVVAKVEASSTGSAEASDPAWAKAQPGLAIYKSYIDGVPRTLNGVVGQTFKADYNIILTNNGYVDTKYPAIIDMPKPAPGLTVVSMRAYDRPFTQGMDLDPDMTVDNDLIEGDAGQELTGNAGGTAWTLRTDQITTRKARSKGNFRLEVIYRVDEVLDRPSNHADDRYVCNNVRDRSGSNRNRGLFNTIDVEKGAGIAPVNIIASNVCYSLVRADTTVTKQINGEGDRVSERDSVEVQKRNKTITNPEGSTSFRVSYVIKNNSSSGKRFIGEKLGDLPSSDIRSVLIQDHTLDGSGAPTNRTVPVSDLSCEGGDTTSTVATVEGGVRVSFDSGLAANKTVTCTGRVDLSGISPDDVHEDVHGDVVKVTPTYKLAATEPSSPDDPRYQSVAEDKNYPSIDTIIGREVSDKAWVNVKLPTDFSIRKSVDGGENPDPVIVEGRPEETFEAIYQVTVENNSATTAKPDSIIETPSAVNGVSVTGVRVVNRQDSNNKLLTSDGPVSLTRNDDGSYTLDQSQFREIPGTSDGNADRSATVDVIVSYEIESSDALPGWVLDPENPDHHPNPSVYEPLTCSGEDRSRGLYNSVAFDGPNRDRQDPPAEDKSSSACVVVAVPRLELEKRIEGTDADNRDEAVAIMPGASKVKISYTVVNTGMVEIEEFTISDRLGELTGSGDTIEITGLVCEEEAEVGAPENNSGVKVKPKPPLAARAPGDGASVDGDGPSTITCSWYADNPAAMRYGDGGFHVNTATVSAQFDKKRPNVGSLSMSHGDSAWAVQLKSLDGTLPKTGGSGIGLFALLSFMFFGCAVYVIRRNRGN